jgi:hypothetical protein
MSARPDSDTCSIAAAAASPTHKLFHTRIADKRIHRANDKLRDIVGRLPPWQSRTGNGGASSETAVVAPLNATYWGLLKQPDDQKLTRLVASACRSSWADLTPFGREI